MTFLNIRHWLPVVALSCALAPMVHAQSADGPMAPTKSREQERIHPNAVPPAFETVIFASDDDGRAKAQQILDLYEILATEPTVEDVSQYIAPGYIQHHPLLPNGAPPVAMLFGASVAQYQVAIDVHKIAVVGDFAMAHVNFRNLSTEDPDDLGIAAVDMYLFGPDGMIVEHWDVLQDVPSHAANTNTMFLTFFDGGE